MSDENRVLNTFEKIEPLYQKTEIEKTENGILITVGAKLYRAFPTVIAPPVYIVDTKDIIHSKKSMLPLMDMNIQQLDAVFEKHEQDFIVKKLQGDPRIETWDDLGMHTFGTDYQFNDATLGKWYNIESGQVTEDWSKLLADILEYNCMRDPALVMANKSSLARGYVMRYQPHALQITPPNTGKSTFFELTGRLVDKATKNTLLGCYDNKTEVLTLDDWKYFKDLTKEDKICTLNPNTREIEYQNPLNIWKYDDYPQLVKIQSRVLDLMVTPDHKMVGTEYNRYTHKNRDLSFVSAKNLPYGFVVPVIGHWTGKETPLFSLPPSPRLHASISIEMDKWLAFLGLYLSEGRTSLSKRGSYVVGISRVKSETKREIEEILNATPFRYKYVGHEYQIYNNQLGRYLIEFGHARKKLVPRYVKECSKRQIEIFLSAYALGDAYKFNNWIAYYTSSKKMAGDLQELLIKIGYGSIVKERQPRVSYIKGRQIKSGIQFEVYGRQKRLNAIIRPQNKSIIDYNDAVYCAEVPNHIMLVRRNGKAIFCGNSAKWTDDKAYGLFHEQYYALAIDQIESQTIENMAGFLLGFLESGRATVAGGGAIMLVTGACPFVVTANPLALQGDHISVMRDILGFLCRNSYAMGRRFGILAYNDYSPLVDNGYDDVEHRKLVATYRALEERITLTLQQFWKHPKVKDFCNLSVYEPSIFTELERCNVIEVASFLRAHVAHSFPHIRGGALNCALVDKLPKLAALEVLAIGDFNSLVDEVIEDAKPYVESLRQINLDSIRYTLS